LGCSDASSVVTNFSELFKHSPDITMETFASLLSRRPDLSKAQVKELVEACSVIHQKKQQVPLRSLLSLTQTRTFIFK